MIINGHISAFVDKPQYVLSVIQYCWTMRHAHEIGYFSFVCLFSYCWSNFGVMWTESTERRRTKFYIDLARQIHIMLKNTGQQFVMCFLTLTCPDFRFTFCVRETSRITTRFSCLKSKSLSTRQRRRKRKQINSLKLRRREWIQIIEIENGRCSNWCDDLS